MKRLAILGSTGSIGRNVLDVVRQFPERFQVVGLAAGRNLALLAEQIREFRPTLVSVAEPQFIPALRQLLPGGNSIPVAAGISGAREVATATSADLVIAAMVGAVGLEPTLAAVEQGIALALANKETLVVAGPLVMAAACQRQVPIIPIDSEHSAIFQAIQGNRPRDIRRLWLTASGGPFWRRSREELATVTAAAALQHPNWSMGPKITIDSATLMNKGLEVIEASVLFNLPAERIQVHVHPESIVHSLVEYIDGSVIAQLGIPDMRVPISYALAYPERLPLALPALNLFQVGKLTFEPPDLDRFPCLGLAFQALAAGGDMPAVLNAANEVAVAAFLRGAIPFPAIPEVVARAMAAHKVQPLSSLAQVLAVDQQTRLSAQTIISHLLE
ncbi:MAG: 1-deoxy-D-xylulose-5-phosphate reductoisomerase [Desulfobacca sp.]|uniref:1-deoxy-D-xylulose-5-phosphate reductoisomerase n=1 Tax=Desulfobacca sp. TaxID=2067990 RepID=UPI004049D889